MITNHLTKELVESVYQKLLFHLKTDNYCVLSRALGCHSKQQIHGCKQNGRIQTNRVINYAIKEGLDLNYLFKEDKT